MFELGASPSHALIALLAALCLMNFLLAATLVLALRRFRSERQAVSQELFGLVKKVEGLTATKREQFQRQYDRLLQDLTKRLPTTIASEASTAIFETESLILTRLAELEPNLRRDDISFKKMDDLIKSMEQLEHTLIASTAQTVERVLVESRSGLLDPEN